jgi:sulfate adenylyltransferase subunit 1 (EFTu-like GTPase family)
LLELLESLPSSLDTRDEPFRFPVQRVLRPDHTFRGFAGQITSGTIRPGGKITVLPSGKSAEVERIVTWDGDLAEAIAPLSVTLVLNRELDISRGDLIVASQEPATVARSVKAALVWMDQRPLEVNRRYLLKHTSHTVPAFVASVQHRTEIGTLTHEPAETLEINGIGVVAINFLHPIALDLYGESRSTGAFVLIDAETNSTVAAGMITAISSNGVAGARTLSGPVTAEERAARWGHRGGVLELDGPADLIDSIERDLFLVESNLRSGLLTLVVTQSDGDALTARVGDDQIIVNADESDAAIAAVRELLQRTGILVSPDSPDWQI